MEYIETIGTQEKASEEILRSDGIIYTFDHTAEQDEYGNPSYRCRGWFLTPFDLDDLYKGKLPMGYQWDATLHKLFRTYQHQRADNEYVYAQRMLRSTGNQEWQSYIESLDQWNAQISALAENFSVDIPDMPSRPTGDD